MCAKDEEREPLQPDGNNKDVKVNIETIHNNYKFHRKWKWKGKHISCQVINELIQDLTKLVNDKNTMFIESESERVNIYLVINELIEDLTKLDNNNNNDNKSEKSKLYRKWKWKGL